jgi:hypothetical protein
MNMCNYRDCVDYMWLIIRLLDYWYWYMIISSCPCNGVLLHGIFEDALCFGNFLSQKEKSIISD